MTDSRKIRYAHQLIDDIANGYTPKPSDLETLRSFLPEPPKQKALEDIIEDVRQVWGATAANAWPEDTHGILEVWLWELHKQLEGLASSSPKPAPALPEGMRLADHEQYGRVITSPKPDQDGVYVLLVPRPNVETGADWEYAHECELTFVGSEPASAAHPEFLETEADYQNAPEGTIVAIGEESPRMKYENVWPAYVNSIARNCDLSGTRRRVLRWGK